MVRVVGKTLKLLVRTETLLPVAVKPVVTHIKQHQRLHAAPGDTVKREFDRYVVLKKSDIKNGLAHEQQKTLIGLIDSVVNHRRDVGKNDLKVVVVEHDWPEYERVWNMIEARVDGHVEENINILRRKAAAFDMLTELMGHVENGTDGIITLFQDDATLSYWVSHRTSGRKENDWQEYGRSLEQAIRNAFEKHGDN